MEAAPDDYFYREFTSDKDTIDSLDLLIARVWKTLSECHAAGGWPYQVSNEDKIGKIEADDMSISTHCMVLFAMGVSLRYISLRDFGPLLEKNALAESNDTAYKHDLSTKLKAVTTTAIEELVENLDEEKLNRSSFGHKNPFTMAWLLSVISGIYLHHEPLRDKIETGDFVANIGTWTNVAVKRLDSLRTADVKLLELNPKTSDAAVHAFPALRAVHLYLTAKRLIDHKDEFSVLAANAQIRSAAKLNPKTILAAGAWFKSRLLDHLAFATIRDAPFDAAELAFSLEGYLLCESDEVEGKTHDPDLVRRAFEVLSERQEITPYWRPLKPLVTTNRGFALLPLSVEIVNSLFRSCGLLGENGEDLFVNNISTFRRYFDWIRSRTVSGRFTTDDSGDEYKFTGWHSEHVQQPGCIHIWETSQVAIYLQHYREMLQMHLARRSLTAARLSTRVITRKKPNDKDLSGKEYWEKRVAVKDPKPSSPTLYSTVQQHFIDCREPRGSGRLGFSVVLFGPPGTGKTSIAEDIAASLGWRFIEITPSDFVVHGESAVELQAREIFSALSEQKDVVILFDEIDRLILDRNSLMYLNQSDMFQVMTPGMLPKIKQLRSAKRSIFLLGTNYVERIDPAAIRVGRFDHQLLVSLPDWEARASILAKELEDEVENLKANFRQAIGDANPVEISANQLEDIADSVVLAAYGELCELVRNSFAKLKEDEMLHNDGDNSYFVVEDVITYLQVSADNFTAGVRIEGYCSRFQVGLLDDEKLQTNMEPVDEFVDLVGLICETPGTRATISPRARKFIIKVLDDLFSRHDVPAGGAGRHVLVRELQNHSRFSELSDSLESIAITIENDLAAWNT